jgi:general secretion pathway protein F
MQTFSYRAVNTTGELVHGSMSVTDAAELERRLRLMQLKPVESAALEKAAPASSHRKIFEFGRANYSESVTNFTMDAALLLRAGMRINQALKLLAEEDDLGQLQPILADVHARIVAGATLSDALRCHPKAFPESYVALVRAGETSGALDKILELISRERRRAADLKRKTADAIRYPAFLLFASAGVLVFFLTFVLPQFSSVLRDFNAKTDFLTTLFIHLSNFLAANKAVLCAFAILILSAALFAAQSDNVRQKTWRLITRMPVIRRFGELHQAALFSRNLQVLQTAAVPISPALKVLSGIMKSAGGPGAWDTVVERVRHGSKMSDALADEALLPPLALRMLRLGEEAGQLGIVAERAADYYEAKLERALERLIGIMGPAAIIAISTVVGGLIASVMSSLLSVTQLVG